MATVQVVGRGMNLTADAMHKAQQGQYYIKIGPKSGELLLSGAEKRWKNPEHAGDLYLPRYRIAGSPAAIQQYFARVGKSAVEIAAELQQAYSAQNTMEGGAMHAAYQAELAAAKALHKQMKDVQAAVPQTPAMTLEQLNYIAAQLGGARAIAGRAVTATGAVAAVAQVGGAKRGGKREPLITRLQRAVQAGKVLDVSLMTADGAGIKPIVRPGGPSKKIGPAGVAVVSSDPTKFAQAMMMLGPGYEHFVAQYNAMLAAPIAAVAPLAAVRVSPRATAAVVSPRALAVPQFAAVPQLAALPTVVPRAPSPRAAVPTIPALPRAASPRAAGFPQGLPTLPGLPAQGVPQLATLPAIPGLATRR